VSFYNAFRLSREVMRDAKVRRLQDAHFRAFIGALCLADESPVRGRLLVTERQPVTERDLAAAANVSDAEAAAALAQLVELGILVEDGRGEGVGLRFKNWNRYNGTDESKGERAKRLARERQRRSRARRAAGGDARAANGNPQLSVAAAREAKDRVAKGATRDEPRTAEEQEAAVRAWRASRRKEKA
jgi:hypothetical protein